MAQFIEQPRTTERNPYLSLFSVGRQAMQYFKSHIFNPKHLMAFGAMLVAFAVLTDLPGLSFLSKKELGDSCKAVVQPNAEISREQLAKLMTVPEGAPKANVQAILKEPYCKLPKVEIRAGAPSERDAYPLAFDQPTQLVVLYEGEQYAGYRFKLR